MLAGRSQPLPRISCRSAPAKSLTWMVGFICGGCRNRSRCHIMAIKVDSRLTANKLLPAIQRLFGLSAEKILRIRKRWNPASGTPVFTIKGRYTSRGWTEWTQGFQFGSALLQFDATREKQFLELGQKKTIELMAMHVSHIGVHDHGFNNISTYGNLWRLMREGRIPFDQGRMDF